MTLIEVMVAVLILAIAITASLETFTIHVRGSRLTEQRRLAYQYAQAKLDEMRLKIAAGWKLDGVFQLYGPLDYAAVPNWDATQPPPPVKGTGASTQLDNASAPIYGAGYVIKISDNTLDLANFVVGDDATNNSMLGINSSLGVNTMVYYLDQIEGRPLGVVTIITNEQPQEGNFGTLLGQAIDTSSSNWYQRNPFGVDVSGDHSCNAVNPMPFPLDINGDGDTGDTLVDFGFKFLPTVVTIQWTSPIGPERVDVFSVLTPEVP
jgi:type II secretory pathway pseudopilin PulG